jgi:hypothetical protein
VQVMLIAAAMPCTGSDTINIHSRRCARRDACRPI